jgi:TetR/AcrR family transcriptional repressor of nem operon
MMIVIRLEAREKLADRGGAPEGWKGGMADKTAHKERTRARILDEAAQALRMHGTDGVSVAGLMKRAGLTHGGFYAHFPSRDDLVAHAIDRMFQDSALLLDRFVGEEGGGGLAALIDYYLSERALDMPEQSCPIPCLAGEAQRMPPAARARFERGIADFRDAMARALEASHREDADDLAASILAEMVGAMALARSFSDRSAAIGMLATSRARLKLRVSAVNARAKADR